MATGLFVVCLWSCQAFAATPSDLTAAAATDEWRRILYYVPKVFGPRTGLIDTPGFYLAPNGQTDAAAELAATLAAFKAPVGDKPDEHALCRFPRRRQWLAARFPDAGIKQIACPAYDGWRETLEVESASLVFSSNYLNNPSSMYGHTFLRLHRRSPAGGEPSPLLDHAVNFAANPTTDNPLLYAVFGLFGRFFGTFSLMPYYLKVQEYNNAESRDLWEYPLHLTPVEVDAFMASLWEAGPHGIRYWYFDENCSYVLLAAIAAAAPRYPSVDEFPNVVTPKDTVAALANVGALGEPKRRLSALGRFRARQSALSDAELTIFDTQRSSRTILPEVLALPPARRAAVLDTVTEWIAYDEGLAGSRQPTKHKELWDAALSARASAGVASPHATLPSTSEGRPEVGHPAQRIAVGSRAPKSGAPAVLLGYRFTLHDFLSPPTGYSSDQEIAMGDFYVSARRNQADKWRLYPEKATIIRILSTPPTNFTTGSTPWTLHFGSERRYRSHYDPQNTPDSWLTHRFDGGMGVGFGVNKFLRAYAIPILAVGKLAPTKSGVQASLGAKAGIVSDLATDWRFSAQGEIERIAGVDGRFARSVLSVSHDVNETHEVRVQIGDAGTASGSLTAQWFVYF